MCPGDGADIVFEIDNETGTTPIAATLAGVRLGQECAEGTLATSYAVALQCSGTGLITCGSIGGLAAGSWRHTVTLTQPNTGQLQHQPSLLLAASEPNVVRFTAFASVMTVRTITDPGSGSLRSILQSVDQAPKPLLIQFDPVVFPAGTPAIIALEFQLPALASDDVTLDGTDSTAATGNRIIDAGGLPPLSLSIPALAITGARNHVIGMYLRNAGGNNRDILSISGSNATANVIERSIIDGALTGDGIGVDQLAGTDFTDSANVIRECEIRNASDKGVKVTTGAYARVERCWVHDNANGGVQATLGGHVQTIHNLIEHNHGSTAQNGLAVNAADDNSAPTSVSELMSWGDISRGNGANGMSVRALSEANVRDDYLATNGSSGIRVFNDVGSAATAVVQGTSAVCNAVDGAVVANTSVADFGGGAFGSPGNNAFTQNNLPAGGANFRNATGALLGAIDNQWEHCGPDTTCDNAAIAAFDLSDHGAETTFVPAQAHRSEQAPSVTAVAPSAGQQDELLRIFGSGFNVIDGHFDQTNCADVAGRNSCVPLRGNCVQINGAAAAVEAVTPTMLVVRWPFTCVQPVPLIVETDHGGTSAPLTVCTNEAPPSSPTPASVPTATLTPVPPTLTPATATPAALRQ
jgi:hypothetical protein